MNQKNLVRILFQIFLIVVFIAGIYVIVLVDKRKTLELMENQINASIQMTPSMDSSKQNPPKEEPTNTNNNCPNLLLHKEGKYYLYNTNLPTDTKNNPLVFSTLSQYSSYLESQYNEGINCPPLFVQEENDSQGNNVLRMRKSPFDLEGGVPTTPANSLYPGFDPHGFNIGVYTQIDKVHDKTVTESGIYSDNPMDSNWGGVLHTEDAINSGKYDENIINRPLLFQPKVDFNTNLPSNIPPPKDILQ
jgi:hypothetical protein